MGAVSILPKLFRAIGGKGGKAGRKLREVKGSDRKLTNFGRTEDGSEFLLEFDSGDPLNVRVDDLLPRARKSNPRSLRDARKELRRKSGSNIGLKKMTEEQLLDEVLLPAAIEQTGRRRAAIGGTAAAGGLIGLGFLGDTTDEALEVQVDAREAEGDAALLIMRRQAALARQERIQRQLEKNIARLATYDPQRYYELVAGRKLANGSQYIGPPEPTGMLEEAALRMGAGEFSEE